MAFPHFHIRPDFDSKKWKLDIGCDYLVTYRVMREGDMTYAIDMFYGKLIDTKNKFINTYRSYDECVFEVNYSIDKDCPKYKTLMFKDLETVSCNVMDLEEFAINKIYQI